MKTVYTTYYKCPQCGRKIGKTTSWNPLSILLICIFPFLISYIVLRDYFDFDVPDYKVCRKCGIAYIINGLHVEEFSIEEMKNNIYFKHRWFFRLFYFVGGISILSLIMGVFGIIDNISWMTVLGFILFLVTFISVIGAVYYWKNK